MRSVYHIAAQNATVFAKTLSADMVCATIVLIEHHKKQVISRIFAPHKSSLV
jgi:hypothetical protein